MKKLLIASTTALVFAALCTAPAYAILPYEASDEIEWLSYEGGELVDSDGDSVVKDDIVPSGQTVYAVLDSRFTDNIPLRQLTNNKYFRVKAFKGDDDRGAIKKVSLERKSINGQCETVVAIELKETKDDREYEISPYIVLTTQKDFGVNTAVLPSFTAWEDEPEVGYIVESNTDLIISVHAYVGNYVDEDSTDYEIEAGKSGRALTPAKNDEAEISWTDENTTIARLLFGADSRPGVIVPNLSTIWPTGAYSSQLDNADAFYYDFSRTSKISSRNRAVLEILNPFYDNDSGSLSVPLEHIAVYQDIDGMLLDVSPMFTASENTDGLPVLTTKARSLGVYIIADKTTMPARSLGGVFDDEEDDNESRFHSSPVPNEYLNGPRMIKQ